MQRRWLWVAMVSAGLLTACGGDGGSGSTPPAANLSISGAAAKGLMANAIVTAHAVDASGQVATAELGRAVTDAKGKYTLSFTGTKGEPYVIKVTAQAGTKHYDEATGGLQDLPAGFSMRTVFVPTETGTVSTSLNVTPFSELAVAAAEKASAGLTKANVEQARSNVAQMLGFDPVVVPVVDFSDRAAVQAASQDSKTLLTMLTAVSVLAKNDAAALGCTQTVAGEKTKCVVEAMSKAARLDTKELKTGSVDISGHLDDASQAVLASPTLNVAKQTPADLARVTSSLNCAATSTCAPAPVSALPAISAAKSLFNNLRSDLNALFVPASAGASSALEVEADRFSTALRDVQVPVEMVGKDLGVMLMGIDLYNAAKANSNVFTRSGAAGLFVDGTSPNYNAVSCQLLKNPTDSQPATSAVDANFISCRASYFVGYSVNPVSKQTDRLDWAHGFTLTPTSNGEFTYSTRARFRSLTANNAVSVTVPDTLVYADAGNVIQTTTVGGQVVGFSVKGKLPGAFAMGGTNLVSQFHTWDLAGSKTGAGNNAAISFSGQVTAFNNDAGSTTQSTLTVKSASLKEIPVSRDAIGNIVAPDSAAAVAPAGGAVGEAGFDVVWATAGAEFEGAISATNVAWDKSKTKHAPTALAISGALRNVNGATKTEFFSGSLNLSATGLGAYDARLENSSSNFVTVNAAVQGQVTAANRPQLQLNVATSMKSFEKQPAQLTASYRSLINGAPTTAVALTLTRTAAGGVVADIKDLTAGLSMVVPQGAASANLMLNGSTKIGVLERSGVLTFADGSFMSLDLGL